MKLIRFKLPGVYFSSYFNTFIIECIWSILHPLLDQMERFKTKTFVFVRMVHRGLASLLDLWWCSVMCSCFRVVPGDPLQERVDAFLWVPREGWMDEALPEQSEKRCAAVQPRTTDGNSWPTDRGGEHCVLFKSTSWRKRFKLKVKGGEFYLLSQFVFAFCLSRCWPLICQYVCLVWTEWILPTWTE